MGVSKFPDISIKDRVLGSRIVFFPIFTRKKTISNANANFQMLYLYYLVLSQRDQNEHGNKIMRV